MKGRELQSTAHPLADAFQLLVIIDTNSAFAEADLWPEIEVDATLAGLHTNALIKAMHRAFTERGQDLGIADYVIDTGRAASPIIGRLIDKGLHDELTGEAYAVIDGTDGRAHHVRSGDRGFRACSPSEAAYAFAGDDPIVQAVDEPFRHKMFGPRRKSAVASPMPARADFSPATSLWFKAADLGDAAKSSAYLGTPDVQPTWSEGQ